MTLTQLNAFVLVARLGSVTAAANPLGVSEPAVSQALSALRLHLGDQLVSRGPNGMTLTTGGSKLLATASQIVVLGAEAHAAVRAAQGAPQQLRVVATSTIAEFVVSPLMEAFTRRFAGSVEVSAGVAATNEMGVLVANRLADIAIGPAVNQDPALPVVSEPIFRYRLVVVTAGESKLKGSARQWRWLVGPSGTDPGSDIGQLLAALHVPDGQIGVFPNQTAAWAAAADGAGVAPAADGTRRCWIASTGAPPPARCGVSSARPRPCISCAPRPPASHRPVSGPLSTSRSGADLRHHPVPGPLKQELIRALRWPSPR